jgi:hypothetical protein
MSKNDKLLPVPLEYTYPIVRSIYLTNKSNRIDKYYYIPELNKWWKVRNKIYDNFYRRGLNYENWLERWIYYDSPSNKLDLDEIELVINKYYFRCFDTTKNYIRNILSNQPSFGKRENFLGLTVMTKYDFIERYEKSRLKSVIKANYDFSYLPEFISSHKEIVKVFVLDIDPKTNATIGEWNTCFDYLVSKHQDHPIIGIKKNKQCTRSTKEEFIRKAEIVYGKGTYGYDKVDYINNSTKVLIYCPRCNEYFYQTPGSHLQGHGCNKCSRKNMVQSTIDERRQEFIRKAEDRFKGIFDYSEIDYVNIDIPVKIRDKRTNQCFYQAPSDHLKSSMKLLNGDSVGELFIRNWLIDNNKSFESRKRIKVNSNEFNIKVIIPDFVLTFNNKIIWIEYNGRQHYEFVDYFHGKDGKKFKKQLNRDKFEIDHCIENDIVLINIPYTFNSQDKVEQLLNRVLLNGEDINTIIDYSKLYKI